MLCSSSKGGVFLKQKELSVWLRVILVVVALCVLFLALVFVPSVGQDIVSANPALEPAYLPCLIFFWLTTVPVYVFLALVWRIALEIRRDNSFCHKNAARLKTCSLLALLDTVLYMIAGLVLAFFHLLHISLIVGGVILCAVGAAVSVCCAALSHLTRKAADMQSEHDLTI